MFLYEKSWEEEEYFAETDREDRSAAGRRSRGKREEGSFGAGILNDSVGIPVSSALRIGVTRSVLFLWTGSVIKVVPRKFRPLYDADHIRDFFMHEKFRRNFRNVTENDDS